MSNYTDTEFEQRARGAFDASVDAVDAQTRSRLNRARQAALAELDRREHSTMLRAWLPAGALAAAAAIVLLMTQSPSGNITPDDVAAGAAIAELPASDEDIDLVSEDPEFYAWSAQQASLVTSGTG